MSTNPRRRIGWISAIVLGGCLVAPAQAAEVIFRPVLLFSAYHDGNVLIIGESGDTGDEAFVAAAELDLIRSTQSSSWTFNYRPVYTAYNENSELDYFGHSGHIGFTKRFSGESTFYTDFAASQTDRQGVRPFRPEQPVTFVERNTEIHADIRVGGTFTSGRRSLIDWEADAGTTQYELDTLDDNVTFGGGAGWRYAFSERNSLGFKLRGDGYLYDERTPVPGEPPPAVDTGATTAHVVGKHNFSEFTVLDYGAGVVFTDSDLGSDTHFSGDVTVTRKMTEFTELSAGARQDVGGGLGTGGPTLDRGAWISYKLRPARRGLEANVLAGIWQRDGEAINGPGAGSVTSWSSLESVGWAFNRYIAVSAIHSFSDQNENENIEQPEIANTSYHSYGFFVRWNINGK